MRVSRIAARHEEAQPIADRVSDTKKQQRASPNPLRVSMFWKRSDDGFVPSKLEQYNADDIFVDRMLTQALMPSGRKWVKPGNVVEALPEAQNFAMSTLRC